MDINVTVHHNSFVLLSCAKMSVESKIFFPQRLSLFAFFFEIILLKQRNFFENILLKQRAAKT